MDFGKESMEHEFERNARTAEAEQSKRAASRVKPQSRRKVVVAMVKTASDKGFYVDIFRSNQMDNDYLFHNVGTSLNLMDAGGKLLPLTETERLEKIYGEGYNWFKKLRRAACPNDFKNNTNGTK